MGSARADSCSRFHLLPRTSRGRWAVGFLGLALGGFVLATLLANAGGLGGSAWLALIVAPAFLATGAGAVFAAVAIFRDGERGGLVAVPVLIGLALLMLLVGEFAGPRH